MIYVRAILSIDREMQLAQGTERAYRGLLRVAEADAAIRALERDIAVVQFGRPQFPAANFEAPVILLFERDVFTRSKWIDSETIALFYLFDIDGNNLRHKGSLELGAETARLLG